MLLDENRSNRGVAVDYCEEWTPFSDDSISDEVVEKLLSIATIKKYRADEVLFIERNAYNLYLLLRGSVEISLVHKNGRKRILAFHTARTFIDDAMISDENTALMIRCLTAVELAVMEQVALSALAQNNPIIYDCILRSVLYKLQGLTQHLANQTFNEVEDRIISLLVSLARKQGRETATGTVIEQSLTHEQIAELVGSTRVRVTQSLKSLQAQGRLGKTGKHYILNTG
ncbi:MAG: Crp/Fnr family transcriptional regulator [Coriobacteriales bacterium]|jgi:CRP/FNR family transcriptional regulator|nr:Crp/Fnr family transcriptional regulator [Coriobacteriales bacterium]